MRAINQFLVCALCALLCVPVAAAQDQQPAARGRAGASQEVTIIIQQQQVSFTAPPSVEQMRLQVFDQSGELVFDSQPQPLNQLDWPLQATTGAALKSGLYGYSLTTKEAGTSETRLRHGHFIVDRAKDRDGADKLWVTSQNDSGVGAELTMARNESDTIAGATFNNDANESGQRKIGQRAEIVGRGGADRAVDPEKQSQSKSEKGQENALGKSGIAAVTAGTVGQIAKFTSATEVGNSGITELNGTIGIGTTTPSNNYKFHVNGQMLLQPGGNGGDFVFGTPNFESGLSIVGTKRADIRFDGSSLKLVAGPLGGPPSNESGIAITTAGNVGIGTATPSTAYKLVVNGQTLMSPGGSGGDVIFGSPNSETGFSIVGSRRADLRFDGASLKLAVGPLGAIPDPRNGVVIDASGNIGIGTLTPGTKLQVSGNGIVEASVVSQNERAILSLGNTLSAGRYVWTLESGVRGVPGAFGIFNRQVGKSGLEIDGNLLVSMKALQLTGGADFAENFDVSAEKRAGIPSAPEIQPGMVVAIDPASPGKLNLSRRAYDRRVAGVISGAGGVKPGMTMGQEQTLADGRYPVALSGRVYVWADATRVAIHPGDLLTTSATPGHAMKAGVPAKAQGAIIGKAMTGLESGKGLVLVLVTLQ